MMGEISKQGLYNYLRVLSKLDAPDILFEEQDQLERKLSAFCYKTWKLQLQKPRFVLATEEDNSGHSIQCDVVQDSRQPLLHQRLQRSS